MGSIPQQVGNENIKLTRIDRSVQPKMGTQEVVHGKRRWQSDIDHVTNLMLVALYKIRLPATHALHAKGVGSCPDLLVKLVIFQAHERNHQ